MTTKEILLESTNQETPNIAVLSLNLNAIEAESAKYATGFESSDIKTFTLYGGDYTPHADADVPNNFVLAAQLEGNKRNFSAVVLGASLMLYNTDWHRTLIDLAAGLVKDGGYLLIPTWLLSQDSPEIAVTREIVAGWLGTPTLDWSYDLVAYKVIPQTITFSTLKWFADRGGQYVYNYAQKFTECDQVNFQHLGLIDTQSAFSRNEEVFPGFRSERPVITDAIPRNNFGEVEYLTMGTGQKFAAVKTVLKRYCQTTGDVRLVDHGTASGLIPLQGLLEKDLNVKDVYLLEPFPNFKSMAYDQFTWLPPELRQSLAYVQTYSEGYEYDGPAGLISFFHMFLLIAPEKRAEVFAKAYEALLPGGCILLWEIPKTPQSEYTTYYDKMLTWDDIATLCEPYDVVANLETRYMKEISLEDHVDQPLVRVIRKPA